MEEDEASEEGEGEAEVEGGKEGRWLDGLAPDGEVVDDERVL